MEASEQIKLSPFGVEQIDGGVLDLKHFAAGSEHAVGDGTLITQAANGPVHTFKGFIKLVFLTEEAAVDESLDTVARPEQQRDRKQHHQENRDCLISTGGAI